MKLHLPLSLRSALLVACAALAALPTSATVAGVAGVGTYYDHSNSGEDCDWTLKSYWNTSYTTLNGVKYYDRIVMGYGHAFQVSSSCVVTKTDNLIKHDKDIHPLVNVNLNGGGQDWGVQCTTFKENGELETPGVWILAKNSMTSASSPVTLTNFKDIVISDSRQQYFYEDAYIHTEDGVKSIKYETTLKDFCDRTPTIDAGCGAQILQVGFDLTVTDTNSFTYQNAYTAGTGSFLTLNKNTVIFDGVKTINFLNNHAVEEGGIWLLAYEGASVTFSNAENITFAGNSSDVQGSIAWANQGNSPTLAFSNVSGKVLFDGNGGNSLFRNVQTTFTDVANLEFSNNKTNLWVAYNDTYEVRITGSDTVLFQNNGSGTRKDIIYDNGRNIKFLVTDCVDVSFIGNEMAQYMFSSTVDGSSAVFTNNDSILFESNRSTDGAILADEAPAFHGVTRYWGAVGNHASRSEDGNVTAALATDSFSVYGGTWDTAADAWGAGKGELFEVRGNSITGHVASIASTQTLSVYHFEKALFNDNSVTPLVNGSETVSDSGFSGMLTKGLVLEDVDSVEIKGNHGTYANAAGNLVYYFTLSDFNTAVVSGNVLNGSWANLTLNGGNIYGILGKEMAVTGRVDAAGNPLSSFTISDNKLTVNSSKNSGKVSNHSLSNLKLFAYTDNRLESNTGQAITYLGGMPQLTNVETVVATGNVLRSGATVGDTTAIVRGAAFSAVSGSSGACFDGVASMTVSSNIAGGLASADNLYAMAYTAWGGAIDMTYGTSTSQASFKNVGNITAEKNEARGSNAAYGGFLCLEGYVNMTGTGGSLILKDNHAYTLAGGKALGGALYLDARKDSNISNFSSISITGNSIEVLGDADPDSTSLKGGAIYQDASSYKLTFADNDYVLIRGNYRSNGASVVLDSIYQTSNTTLQLTPLSGQKIEMYDGMTLGTLVIGAADTECGTVLISGKYTEEDLAALNSDYTDADVEASRLVSAYAAQVLSGTLTLSDGMHLNTTTGGVKVTGASARMYVDGATLTSADTVTLSNGALLKLTNATLSAGDDLTVGTASRLELHKSEAVINSPVTLSGASTLEAKESTLSSTGTVALKGASELNVERSELTIGGELQVIEASQMVARDTSISVSNVVTLDDANSRLSLDHSSLDTKGKNLKLTYGAALVATNDSHLYTGEVALSQTSSLSLENTRLDASGYISVGGTASVILKQSTLTSTGTFTATSTSSLSLERSTLTSAGAFSVISSATLSMTDSSITAASFKPITASFSGVNTVTVTGSGEAVYVNNNGTVWTLNLTAANLAHSVLTIDFSSEGGNLSSRNQSLVLAAAGNLAAGEYRLLTFANEKSGSLAFLNSMSISGLVEQKGVTADPQSSVYYVYENGGASLTLMYKILAPEIPSRTEPTTLTWAATSGCWTSGSGRDEGTWAGDTYDLNFYDGDSVVFASAADVELRGAVLPASVLVSNEAGTVKLHGEGLIAGESALSKTGKGTLRLETANSYTGGTTLWDGTLELGNAHALGLNEVLLKGGTLDMGSQAVTNFVQVDGTVELRGASAFAGELYMTGGSLSGEAINLEQGALLMDGTISNTLTGNGYVWVDGADDDTVELKSANSYKGGTVLESGTLKLGNATALGEGELFIDGGTLDMGGNTVTNGVTVEGHAHIDNASAYAGWLTMESGSLSGDAINLNEYAELVEGTIYNDLKGTAGVVKTGSGTATLAGANTYEGVTAVQQGTLVLEGSVAGDIIVASKATLAAESPLVLQNQTLALAKNATVKGDITTTFQSILYAEGAASISGTLTLNGGALLVSSSGLALGSLVTGENSTLLSVDNLASLKNGTYKLLTYKKGSLLSDLQLDVSNSGGERPAWTLAMGKTAVSLVVNFSKATLTWNNATGTWGVSTPEAQWTTKAADKAFYNGDNVVFGMPADVEITTQVAPSGITVQGKGEVRFYGDGSITGDAALTMKSSGTLTLETANSYTGGTTISKGTVVVGHESALGSGSVTLKGGTLDMGGFNIANELSVGANSTLSGADTYTGTLTVNKGTLTLLSDVAGDIELAKSTTLARKESSKDKTFSTLSLAEGASLALGSGAKVKGSLELTSGQTLSTAGKNNISETLTLGGGTVIFGKSGLSVKDIAITSETDVEVSDMLLYKKGSHKLISYSAKDATPDVDKLQLDSTQIIDSRMEGSWLSLGKKAIMLNITESCAKLSWKSDEAGTWSVKSGSEWTAAKSVTDKHFYQGDHVTLSKGALTLNGELAPGSITVNVGAKDSVTLSGDGSLVGGTSLIMKGKGALTLNTANSYTGGTTISSGSVTLGHAEALGSGAVELKGGSLDLNEEALGNDLIVSKNATLLGAQNYTGTLTHNGGTLKGDSINLAEDAIIKAGTIMNALVGEGGLIKTGKGSATLAGENSYTGLTDVQGGTLILKNNHSGSIRLGDKTKLTLSNSSKTLSLGSGQRLSLGSGASVSGSVSMGSNSWLSTSSKSSISGTLTLGGGTLCFDQLGLKVGKLSITGNTTLDVSGLTFEKAGSYQLISYKGAATATDYLELLGAEDSDYTYTLQSGKNTLTLIVSEAAEGIALLSEDEPLEPQNDAAAAKPQPAARATAFATDGTHARRRAMGALLSSNQRSVYEALCAVADSGSANQALANISQAAAASNDLSQLRTLLESVSGAQYATAMSSQIEGNLAHLRLLGSRAGSGQQLQGGDGRLAAYLGATSSNTHIGADASGYGYDRNEWGGQAGAEYRTACGGTLGLAVSESLARINPSTGKRAEETRTSFDLYGLKTIGSWNFRTMAGVGIHRHEYQPRDIAGLVAANAGKTHLDGYSLNFVEDISYTVRLSDEITLKPFAAVESSFNHISSFREAGYGTASLSGASQQAWATDITLGLRYNQQFHLVSDAPQAVFSAHVGSTASIGDTADTLRLHFAGAPGYGFEQRSAKRDRWAMSVGTSVNVPVSGKTSIYASVDALLRGDSSSVDAQAGVQIAF